MIDRIGFNELRFDWIQSLRWKKNANVHISSKSGAIILWTGVNLAAAAARGFLKIFPPTSTNKGDAVDSKEMVKD